MVQWRAVRPRADFARRKRLRCVHTLYDGDVSLQELMDALLQSPLARLLAETFDSALAASYRSFALALADLLEARLTQGAEVLLGPMLRALSQALGGSWRQWAAIAAIGLVLRARRLVSRPLRVPFYSRPYVPSTPFAPEASGPIHRSEAASGSHDHGTTTMTLSMPTMRADGAAAFPLPDGSGTWFFVPRGSQRQQQESAEEELRWQVGSPALAGPLMLAGPGVRSLAHRSRL